MPAQTYPGGYVCLIRDVAYGNRYMLLRLRDPRGLKRRLIDNRNFKTELAYAWQAADAAAAEAFLRGLWAPGAGRGEWFDLEDEQLAQHTSADYLDHQPTWLAGSRISAVAILKGARPHWPRSIATAVIALLLLAVLLLPHHESSPPLGEDKESASANAAPDDSADRYLAEPLARLLWDGEELIARWNKVDGANMYEYRYRFNAKPLPSFRSTRGLRASLAGYTPGDTVWFEIIARRGGSRSRVATFFVSPEVKPEAPGLHHVWSGRQLIVKWDNVEGATGYEYRYQVSARKFSTYKSTRSLRVSLTNLWPGDVVIFDVRAKNGGLRSDTVRRVFNIPSNAKPESPRLTMSGPGGI